MTIPGHVTELTREDFREIVAATNPVSGIGISVTKKSDSIEIAIDETQLKRMIWAFNRNGGFSATADDIESISLDPQG